MNVIPPERNRQVPTPYRAPLGAPIWIDLTSSDTERAQQFYGAVFGWTFESAGADYGGYLNAAIDGHPVAGLMQNDPQWNSPDGWTTYLHTADINAVVDAIKQAGGTSCVEPMEVKDKGWMSMVTDPAGAFFGLWQPTGHHGFEVVGQHGAPVWHQLTTRDYDKALEFYGQVFGWQTQIEADSEEFRYSTAVFDGEQRLGVMDGSRILPDGTPSHWVVFLGSDDVDKTLSVITDHGGSVLRPAEDTPYGRLASAADPTGAVFNVASADATAR